MTNPHTEFTENINRMRHNAEGPFPALASRAEKLHRISQMRERLDSELVLLVQHLAAGAQSMAAEFTLRVGDEPILSSDIEFLMYSQLTEYQTRKGEVTKFHAYLVLRDVCSTLAKP